MNISLDYRKSGAFKTNKMRNIIWKRYMGQGIFFRLLPNNMHAINKCGVYFIWNCSYGKGWITCHSNKLHNIREPPALDYKFQHLTHKYNFGFIFAHSQNFINSIFSVSVAHDTLQLQTRPHASAFAHLIDPAIFRTVQFSNAIPFTRIHILAGWIRMSMIFRNASINIRCIRHF